MIPAARGHAQDASLVTDHGILLICNVEERAACGLRK